jgi:CDP-diacylglycerol--serine O-phosphatidyltransferase
LNSLLTDSGNKKLSPFAHLIPPNLLTLCGLAFSLLAVQEASRHRIVLGAAWLMLAGLTDLFDGLLARRWKRSEEQIEVGKQLDSLVDLVSFGFAPVLFAWFSGLRGIAGEVPLLFYFLACALRLAIFNARPTQGYYRGLPVTYIGLWLPLSVATTGFFGKPLLPWVLGSGFLIHGVLMHVDRKFPKPGGIWYGIFPAIAVGLAGAFFFLGLTKVW